MVLGGSVAGGSPLGALAVWLGAGETMWVKLLLLLLTVMLPKGCEVVGCSRLWRQ